MKKVCLPTLLSLLVTCFSCSKKDEFNPVHFSFQQSDNTFFLPMAFTPNGDHLNDTYRMLRVSPTGVVDNITDFTLDIKDKNTLLFSTQDPYFEWDGRGTTGYPYTGVFKVWLELGLNNGPIRRYNTHVQVIRSGCVPAGAAGLMFGDMIDARYGAVYPTQEPLCQ